MGKQINWKRPTRRISSQVVSVRALNAGNRHEPLVGIAMKDEVPTQKPYFLLIDCTQAERLVGAITKVIEIARSNERRGLLEGEAEDIPG